MGRRNKRQIFGANKHKKKVLAENLKRAREAYRAVKQQRLREAESLTLPPTENQPAKEREVEIGSQPLTTSDIEVGPQSQTKSETETAPEPQTTFKINEQPKESIETSTTGETKSSKETKICKQPKKSIVQEHSETTSENPSTSKSSRLRARPRPKPTAAEGISSGTKFPTKKKKKKKNTKQPCIKDDRPQKIVPAKEQNQLNTKKGSDLHICRVCLATDVKMYPLRSVTKGSIATSLSKSPQLPKLICYECAPTFIKFNKFMQKAKIAEKTLLDVLIKYGKITENLIQKKNRYKLNLETSLSKVFIMSMEVSSDTDLYLDRGNIDRYIDTDGETEQYTMETTEEPNDLTLDTDGETEQYTMETTEQPNDLTLDTDRETEQYTMETTEQPNDLILDTDRAIEQYIIETTEQPTVVDPLEFENIQLKAELEEGCFNSEEHRASGTNPEDHPSVPEDFDQIIVKVEQDDALVEETEEINIELKNNKSNNDIYNIGAGNIDVVNVEEFSAEKVDPNDVTNKINPQTTKAEKRPGAIIPQELQTTAKVTKQDANVMVSHDTDTSYFHTGRRPLDFLETIALCQEIVPAAWKTPDNDNAGSGNS